MKRKRPGSEVVNRCQANISSFFKTPLMQGTNTTNTEEEFTDTKRSCPEATITQQSTPIASNTTSHLSETNSLSTPRNIGIETPISRASSSNSNKSVYFTPSELLSAPDISGGSISCSHKSRYFTLGKASTPRNMSVIKTPSTSYSNKPIYISPSESLSVTYSESESEYHTELEDLDTDHTDTDKELSCEEEDELLKETTDEENSGMNTHSVDKKEDCRSAERGSVSSTSPVNSDVDEQKSSGISSPDSRQPSASPEHVANTDNSDAAAIYPENSCDMDLCNDSIPVESDSDDDLLSPPAFLYEQKPNIHVLTPKKATKPVNASPIASPVKAMKVEPNVKYRFSVSKLLNDRNRKEKKNEELIKMEEDLDEGIKMGNKFSESDWDDSETFDDGRDLSQCKQLPTEIKPYLGKVNNFSEEMPGEDIFPILYHVPLETEMPFFSAGNPESNDQFLQVLAKSTPLEIRELVCGGWFLQYFLKRPCPAPVAEWLFNVMCCTPDRHISTCCYKALWALLKSGTQDTNGIPRGIRGMNWVPSVQHMIKVLIQYGATPDSLISIDPLTLGISQDSQELLKPLKVEDSMDEATEAHPGTSRSFPVYTIGQLVQFVTHSLQMAPLNYTVDHLHQLMVILCRLSLDVRLQTVLFDIEMGLLSILNCFGESQWEEEVVELAKIMSQLSSSHPNLVHIVQLLPPSLRGIQLQRLLGFVLLQRFVKEFMASSVQGNKVKNEPAENSSTVTTVQISQIVPLVVSIKPQDDTESYYLLHTIIMLVDLAVGSEILPSSERADLVKLSNSLQALNGDIKDPRAAFLDRTKVKDLLVRTISKINFLIRCIQPPKERSLTSYFDTDSSEYVVETLKESASPAMVGITSASYLKDEYISSPDVSSPGDASNSDRNEEEDQMCLSEEDSKLNQDADKSIASEI